MSFTPLETTSRSAAGCKFGISIHPHSKTKPGAGGTMQISIHPDLMRKASYKKDEIYRLDHDPKIKAIRLTPVMKLGKAPRRMKVSASGRGNWSIPYTGKVADVIPNVPSVTDLTVLEITSEGITAQLH